MTQYRDRGDPHDDDIDGDKTMTNGYVKRVDVLLIDAPRSAGSSLMSHIFVALMTVLLMIRKSP